MAVDWHMPSMHVEARHSSVDAGQSEVELQVGDGIVVEDVEGSTVVVSSVEVLAVLVLVPVGVELVVPVVVSAGDELLSSVLVRAPVVSSLATEVEPTRMPVEAVVVLTELAP